MYRSFTKAGLLALVTTSFWRCSNEVAAFVDDGQSLQAVTRVVPGPSTRGQRKMARFLQDFVFDDDDSISFSCPADKPVSGETECDGTPVCNYGREACCGQSFPTSTCECFEGNFKCFDFANCPGRVCSDDCPKEEPKHESACDRPSANTCAYKPITCCGKSYHRTVLQCFDGKWDCTIDILAEFDCMACADKPDPKDLTIKFTPSPSSPPTPNPTPQPTPNPTPQPTLPPTSPPTRNIAVAQGKPTSKPKPSQCRRRPRRVRDQGHQDSYRGHYQINGCCYYCRWVGASGSGGDPKRRVRYGRSWWSCSFTREYSSAPRSGKFAYPKCKNTPTIKPRPKPNQSKCNRAPRRIRNLGFRDSYRGYYRVGGCCYYCRWVGSSGSGGNPRGRVRYGRSWWSCRISSEYSSAPRSGHFIYPKCNKGKPNLKTLRPKPKTFRPKPKPYRPKPKPYQPKPKPKRSKPKPFRPKPKTFRPKPKPKPKPFRPKPKPKPKRNKPKSKPYRKWFKRQRNLRLTDSETEDATDIDT